MQSPDATNFYHNAASTEEPNEKNLNQSVVGADRFNDAIVVQFDDGICARFPAKLLRSMVSQLDPSSIQTEGLVQHLSNHKSER